jgi:hypothetical protein
VRELQLKKKGEGGREYGYEVRMETKQRKI